MEYVTKNRSRGFDADKVHVFVRRRQLDPNYPIDSITEDLEWLARWVVAQKLRSMIGEHSRQDLVQTLQLDALKAIDRYPWQNKLGGREPAFAYFSIVMYHSGIHFLNKMRRGEYVPIDEEHDKPIDSKDFVSLEATDFVSGKMERIYQLSCRRFMDFEPHDSLLRKTMRLTAKKCELQEVKDPTVNRYYRVLTMLVMDKSLIPEAQTLTQENRVLALFLGSKRKARQWQHISDVLNNTEEN